MDYTNVFAQYLDVQMIVVVSGTMQGSRKKQHKNISSNLMELPELCMELSHASYPFERRVGLGKSWDGFTLSAMAALCSMPLNCFCRLSSKMVKKPQFMLMHSFPWLLVLLGLRQAGHLVQCSLSISCLWPSVLSSSYGIVSLHSAHLLLPPQAFRVTMPLPSSPWSYSDSYPT